jgi:putative transposase
MRSRYRFGEADAPHFLTCTVVGWQAVFTRPDTAQFLLDSLTFLQNNHRITLFGYVVLENHMHMIAAAPDLSEQIRNFKSFTARRVIDFLTDQKQEAMLRLLAMFKLSHKSGSDFQLWQEGSHPQMIQDEDMMIQKLEYIHMNPVKRGYVDEPTHWRYSSARNYAGLLGLIPVSTDWR